jgi:hypothetical protein
LIHFYVLPFPKQAALSTLKYTIKFIIFPSFGKILDSKIHSTPLMALILRNGAMECFAYASEFGQVFGDDGGGYGCLSQKEILSGSHAGAWER